MFNRNAAINLIKQFVSNCNQHNIFFDKVVLFGSANKNTSSINSDVDVLLISSSFQLNPFYNAKLLAPVQKKFNEIDAHAFPTDYFKKGDSFITEILKTGVEIEF